MKSKIILLLGIIALSLSSFTNVQENTITALASYDGFEYDIYTYTFIIPSTNANEADTILAFSKVPESIFKKFDLKSEELIGTNFEVTYKIVENEVTDKNELPEEVNILISLKELAISK